MKNKKLKNKILIRVGLLLIIAGIILNLIIKGIIEHNESNVIKNDINIKKNNSIDMIEQFFVINDKPLNEENLVFYSAEICKKLSNYFNATVGIYDINGEFGNKTIVGTEDKSINEHIIKAKSNKSYIVFNDKLDDNKAYFAYPLYIKGDFLGIVEIIPEYKELMKNNKSLYYLFTITEFIFVFLLLIFIYLIISRSTKGLEDLQKGVKEVSKGNYNYEIAVKKNDDEVEELAKEYNEMRDKIKRQIGDIHNFENSRREFFCNITHELKTPLTSITGYAELLKDNYYNDILRDRAISSMISESNKLNNMICNILEASKGQVLCKSNETIQVGLLLKETIEEMKIRLNYKHISIDFKIEDCNIIGVEDEIKSVFINILENAIKYSKDDEEIKVITKIIDSFYEIQVINKTLNLDDNFKYRAFEPFVRGENSLNDDRGNGLGLYICKYIIEEHGGSIKMDIKNNEVKINIRLIAM
ncbi:hypothetical protein SAMN02745163_02702 [Clostridium cavendishii DSM 21758]|uniref:histidine kinase n=1 Tax=Clostridium cavendishii DSM 21758 TaxID=1121302 RepID=A0A1M6MNC7_9CLOT|nr:HAMP domain-containing sensor histidine kinase [Clostridium cavendishii]SHJ84944.1 hypothetical protein SAMN02745163_02702 [Clostridium cavendishii DSM 21758]